ncbi:MAG: hypothetical protein OEM82_12040 [Acidobacteriota bacterium]|nr:hypothetical protein [Acidobacteriota bacterium]MDH3531094.1 hypothetical protein [Acidobacteriota bacterium]
MSEKRVEIDPNLPYQKNEIGVAGILYFGIGLFLLIVVTFALMWVFQYQVLEPDAVARDKENVSPVAMSEDQRLPPEPRLQSAPGFGVDSKDGRIILERREPQAEYRILQKQWKELWENGEKDEKTGTVTALSMEAAKEKILSEGSVKSVTGAKGEDALKDASMIFSSSSAGRIASEKKR